MTRPRLLDLYCCAGGAGWGYHLAGFDVVGVDIFPQPRYPFEFHQRDVLNLEPEYLATFDAIHASPPCKVHTSMKAFSGSHHRDLIEPTRQLLMASGRPYIIENVVGAPLIDPILLCGSMFGMHVRRHRLFESNIDLWAPRCMHWEQESNSPGFTVKRYHSGQPESYVSPVVGVFGGGQGYGAGETELWRDVMGMPWAGKREMAEAIPPAYTEFLGEQLMVTIKTGEGAAKVQTFLPYPNFACSAMVLDRQRLGKQRLEAQQILSAIRNGGGWRNHPAVKMWRGHEAALMLYHDVMVREWVRRGYVSTMREYAPPLEQIVMPSWLGGEEFHASHRAALLAKDPRYYSIFEWSEEPAVEYVWPTSEPLAPVV